MAIPYVKQTWTDGVSSASAARLGVIEQGIFDAHAMPSASAKRTSAFAIANNTWTLLLLNGEDFDTDTIHDNATNSARLTAKTAGKYLVAYSLVWEANSTGIRQSQVQFNSEALPATGGTDVIKASESGNAATGTRTYQSASNIVAMAVNDYVAIVVLQNSGGSLNVEVDTYFSMVRVA